MSLIEPSFVIASIHPKELAGFYAKVNQVEVVKGVTNHHYLVPFLSGLNIQFYRPSNSKSWPSKGRSTSICFQKKPSSNPLRVIDEWSDYLISLGGKIVETARDDAFGAEAWISDPEGNEFLIVVPLLN